MADRTPTLGLAQLADEPQIYDILLAHGMRGVRIQVLLRFVLALFVLLTVVLEPPADDTIACYVIAGCYAAWTVGVAKFASSGGLAVVRLIWLALFVDLIVLTAITVVAGASDEVSWTADILVNGFVLVPLLAATQLRPWVCVAVVVPTVVVYFASSAAARLANTEPWESIGLRTVVLAGLGAGCVLLSRVQRSRVVTIASLASDRSRLLAETVRIEERERRDLAEHLHDGALQYVLAARQDLEDVRSSGDARAVDRIDEALRESALLLRSTMTELHPAVLEQSGLASALADLTRSVSARRPLTISLDTAGWPADLRTPVDPLLFATARELLSNVVKHAAAGHVEVTAELDDGTARLVVLDDGTGIDETVLAQRLADGHIGLASRRVRLEAAGGALRVQAREPHGTVAVAELPVQLA
jgi:two-component system, NarL family, sensor kinase